jgi:hypothetical protein
VDRATPSTWRDLVHARLAAQERAGIPEAQMAPLYSGDVEGYLMPIIMRMGKGEEPSVLAQMRQHLRRTYGEHAEAVLGFMLRTYAHGSTDKLLALRVGEGGRLSREKPTIPNRCSGVYDASSASSLRRPCLTILQPPLLPPDGRKGLARPQTRSRQ